MAVTTNPVIDTSLSPQTNVAGVNPIRMLITGQIGSAGTAVSLQAYQDVQTFTITQIKTLFGTASELTGRILRALNISGGNCSIWVIGISPVAGTDASFSMAITGTATAAGTITLKLIDSKLFTINVDVNIGDTNTVVAANIVTAINALTAFPATVSALYGTITFTATDSGTLGNKYTILASNVPAGLAVPSGQFTSGATDPTLTNMLTNVGSTRFQSISWPWQTAYSVVKSYLEGRNTISNAFLQGLCYIGNDDTETNIHTALNGATPVNSTVLVFMGNRQGAGVSQLITPPDWRAVEFMAIEALRLTPGAPIAPYVSTSSPLDLIGGPGTASLPLFNTLLPNTDVEIPDNLFSATEQANAITDGFSVIGVNTSVSSAITGQVVTTYKYNPQGLPDPTFKYVEYVRTGYTALEYIFNNLQQTYAQMRLTEGGAIGGRAMVNITGIGLYLQKLYSDLSGPAYVLTPAGQTAMTFFKSNLVLTPNYATGSVTITGQLPIVTQLRSINMPFTLTFTVGGN